MTQSDAPIRNTDSPLFCGTRRVEAQSGSRKNVFLKRNISAIQFIQKMAPALVAALVLELAWLGLCDPDAASEGCFELPGPLCVMNRERGGVGLVLGAGRPPDRLACGFDFDGGAPMSQDTVSRGCRLFPEPSSAGPGFGGHGGSLILSDNATFTLAAPATEDGTVSVGMWIFLLTERQRALSGEARVVSRGVRDQAGHVSVQINLHSGRLRATVSDRLGYTTSAASRSRVTPRRWTHVALSVSPRLVEMYVNGIKDTSAVMARGPGHTTAPWRLGGRLPGQAHAVSCFLDTVRVIDGPFEVDAVAATAQAALSGVSSTGVRLGCLSCSYSDAMTRCSRDNERLCALADLIASGGLLVARVMGWVDLTHTEIWGVGQIDASDGVVTAAALCCLV